MYTYLNYFPESMYEIKGISTYEFPISTVFDLDSFIGCMIDGCTGSLLYYKGIESKLTDEYVDSLIEGDYAYKAEDVRIAVEIFKCAVKDIERVNK